MRSFTVTARDDGVRLNRFLQRCAPALPGSLMYKFLREKKIKLNGGRCEASSRLAAGDLLELYIPDEFFEREERPRDFMRAARQLDILYEDDDFAALCKPAGLLVHADAGEYCDTLLGRFTRRLFETGRYDPDDPAAFAPAACNRLDRNTEGIVLAAKSPLAARELDGMISRRCVDKRYICVCGAKAPADGEYRAYLKKDERSNTALVSDRPTDGAKEIATRFRALQRRGGLSLVEARLITGRPHQIRAHLKYLGSPVLGDPKYGDAALNARLRERSQLLCAYRLCFELDGAAKAGPLGGLDGMAIALPRVGFAEKYFPGYVLKP